MYSHRYVDRIPHVLLHLYDVFDMPIPPLLVPYAERPTPAAGEQPQQSQLPEAPVTTSAAPAIDTAQPSSTSALWAKSARERLAALAGKTIPMQQLNHFTQVLHNPKTFFREVTYGKRKKRRAAHGDSKRLAVEVEAAAAGTEWDSLSSSVHSEALVRSSDPSSLVSPAADSGAGVGSHAPSLVRRGSLRGRGRRGESDTDADDEVAAILEPPVVVCESPPGSPSRSLPALQDSLASLVRQASGRVSKDLAPESPPPQPSFSALLRPKK